MGLEREPLVQTVCQHFDFITLGQEQLAHDGIDDLKQPVISDFQGMSSEDVLDKLTLHYRHQGICNHAELSFEALKDLAPRGLRRLDAPWTSAVFS